MKAVYGQFLGFLGEPKTVALIFLALKVRPLVTVQPDTYSLSNSREVGCNLAKWQLKIDLKSIKRIFCVKEESTITCETFVEKHGNLGF